MYTVSTELKNILKSNTSTNKAYVILTDLTTSIETVIDGESMAKIDISINAIPDNRLVGSIAKGTCYVEFVGDIAATLDLAHEYELQPFIGVLLSGGTVEYIPQQTFFVNEYEYKQDVKKTVFSCVDYTQKLNKPYVSTINFTLNPTLFDVLEDVCSQCGIALNNTTIFNGSFAIDTTMYLDELTNYQVLNYILDLALSFAYMNRSNELVIKQASSIVYTNTFVETITKAQAREFTIYQDSFKTLGVNTLTLILNNTVQVENVSLTDPTNYAIDGYVELSITDNPFIWNSTLKNSVITAMLAEILGFNYRAYNVVSKIAPYLDLGDIIKLDTNIDNSISYSAVLDINILFDGAIKVELNAGAETLAQTTYKQTGTLTNRVRKAEISIDKANGEISLVVSSVNEVESDVASLVVSVDSITTTVENDVLGDSAESLKSQITQTASDVTTVITDVNDIQTVFQSTVDGFSIVKGDVSIIGNVSGVPYVAISDGTGDVATIQSNTMTINNIVVNDSIIIGQHKISKYYDGAKYITIVQLI